MKPPNTIYLSENNLVNKGGVYRIDSKEPHTKKYYSEDLIAEIKKQIHAKMDSFKSDEELNAFSTALIVISEVLKDE
jgi:hypothetical protein